MEEMQTSLRQHLDEVQQIRGLVIQIEASEREHIVALDVLSGLPKDRRCYRLVGDVLVERSAAEVLESIKANAQNLRDAVENNTKRAKQIEPEVISLTKRIKEAAGEA